MKDIICIDLTKMSYSDIRDFCEIYELSYDAIYSLKERTYAKIWLLDGLSMAFTLIKDNDFDISDYDTIRMFNKFPNELASVKGL